MREQTSRHITDSSRRLALAKKIKEERLRMNMTQQELADCFGVGITTIQQWEWGINIPSKKYWPLLAKYLGIRLKK